jgi:lipopolysaccharide export system protein LptA
MTSWQRRARVALVVFIAAFGLAVIVAIRERREPPPGEAIERVDPTAAVETTGAHIVQTRGGQEEFRIEAERYLSYPDGSLRIPASSDGTPVTVTVTGRGGRDFVLKGREAEVGPDQSVATISGDVRLAGSDGLSVAADQATYEQSAEIIRIPGPLTFRRGRLAGSGVGAVYERQTDVLRLLTEARLAVAGAADGAGGVDLTAGTATLERAAHTLRFEHLRAVHGGRVVEADAAVAHLREDDSGLERLDLRGNSRITAAPGGAGSLRALRADDMDLHYAAADQTLERATLAGAAQMELGADGRPQRLAARRMAIELAPDGATLTRLDADGDVELDVPPQGGAAGRLIRATTLESRGETGRGLTRARFAGGVDFREHGPAVAGSTAAARQARAETLELSVRAGLADVETARFAGGVRFTAPPLTAEAPEASYDVGRGTLDLRATAGPAGSLPHVTDERVAIDAARILIGLDGRRMTAEGDVRSIFQPSAGPDTATTLKTPGLLSAGEPVNVTAGHLDYDGQAGRAVYTGDARLWQGDTQLQSDRLEIDERTGNLTASGSVRSVMMLEQVDERTKVTERVPTTAAGDGLVYEEASRRAIYTTGAQAHGPQGHVLADTLVLFLDSTGRRLERAEAHGAVTVTIEQRTATGSQLTYSAADQRYVMQGAPVRMLEKTPGECRETTGRALTFFRSTDTISVDGRDVPTYTRVKGDCPERRP